MTPKISVLLSVYNGEKYLSEAIESILHQTFKDFECIIINDGSTDTTARIIARYNDPRIVVVHNERNIGLVKSLNKGLAVARGEYIARMDADDISLPDRFEKQVNVLERHPEIGVLGTAMKQVDVKGRVLSTLTMPTDHGLIFWTMFFDLAVIHASVMMRRKVVLDAGGYNEEYIHVEDTELWSRLIFETRFANLPEPLYIRRLHSQSIISTQSTLQNRRTVEIKERMFAHILGTAISHVVVAWLWGQSVALTTQDKSDAIRMLRSLHEVFERNETISEEIKKKIKEDVSRRIELVENSEKGRFAKYLIGLLKKILPAPLRHRLRVSTLGLFFKRKM